ncbi:MULTISPECIES: tRNA pseudouridine(38-40) synthase TruA [Pseudobutyrivibrio]|uniref:tRNA pseudouridine(38-40) synthase TruA n=1 Tax=Pseudobutyrivibrio TaxID=46205 RepID=UPI000483A280|nr:MULTISPECIES: tRNA pseudouridine(38-40) synthase TruA [Pseudobutyrivibrio]MBP3262972.1 tRNA pseudouridine(38-40) synthase TruA [Pseudobutyrivibrio sp.]MBQ6463252.1 tRNA pseudouridine(38-40) synthase TruA [Pseudobutyrivibrio sp.]MBQ7148031.1 tRNA pseudouridine(38-40) synthase TruA [Pseudobutyrivibrio sp.]
MRVMIVVAYDGSNYSGWQIQPNGVTIEQKLNEALTDLLQEPISIMGASRTDAGVHSLGNVAVFDTNSRMPADKISFALNQRLPDDIVVQYSCQVEDDFHPRYAACRKTYEYKILNRKMPDPTKRKDTFHYYYDLDVDKMNEAAAYLIGQHDFTSFSSVKAQVKSRVRTIYTAKVYKEDDVIHIRLTGDGFLYNMVRIIAGTLIKVGAGEMEPMYMLEILRGRNRELAGPTAPAHGLTMIGIEYEE